MIYTLKPSEVRPYYDYPLPDVVGTTDLVAAVSDGSDDTYLVVYEDGDIDYEAWVVFPLVDIPEEQDIIDVRITGRWKLIDGTANDTASWYASIDPEVIDDSLFGQTEPHPTDEWVTHPMGNGKSDRWPSKEELRTYVVGVDIWNYGPDRLGLSDMTMTIETNSGTEDQATTSGYGYSNIVEITNKTWESELRALNPDYPEYGGFSVTCTKISANRAVVTWYQATYVYPLVAGVVHQQPHMNAILVDATGKEPVVIDRAVWKIADGLAEEYKYQNLSPNGGAYQLLLPNGDVFVNHTSGMYSETVTDLEEGYGTNLASIAACVSVSGDSISFKWHKRWGQTTASTYGSGDFQNVPMWDASDNTILIYVADEADYIRVNPNTGSWISSGSCSTPDTTNDWFGSCVIYKGDKFVTFKQAVGATTNECGYYKGSISSASIDSTVHYLGYAPSYVTPQAWIWPDDKYNTPTHDPETDTWLIHGWLWTGDSTEAHEDFPHVFRYDIDDNGDPVLLDIYTQDVATWSYNPTYPDEGIYNSPTMAWSGGWSGDVNRDPIVVMPKGEVTQVWQGTANYNYNSNYLAANYSQNRGGSISVLYNLGKYNQTWTGGYGFAEMGRFGSPPMGFEMQTPFGTPYTSAGNWDYWMESDDQWGYGYNYSFYLGTCYIGSKILVVMSMANEWGWPSGAEGDAIVHERGMGNVCMASFDPALFRIPPPLKMTQRDDDKKTGAKRLGYDSVNSGDIRLGTVAW